MELRAALAALQALTRPCTVEIHTDSEYVKQGVTEWLAGWMRNGWRTSSKQPVKNRDLWQALNTAMQPHRITWTWVRGHAGDEFNERADRLAVAALNTIGVKGQPDLDGPDAYNTCLTNRPKTKDESIVLVLRRSSFVGKHPWTTTPISSARCRRWCAATPWNWPIWAGRAPSSAPA